jgi:pSer/pThr/pTyr-binding forkhead associated (FHA) protein
MVQLKILSGKKAGAVWVARRFPVRVGRSAASELQLEEDGVWDEHFQINFDPAAGFLLATRPDAHVTVNGQPAQNVLLRNGDLLEIGSLKLQFWLAESRQRALLAREAFLWAIVTAVFLSQIALIYWLIE